MIRAISSKYKKGREGLATIYLAWPKGRDHVVWERSFPRLPPGALLRSERALTGGTSTVRFFVGDAEDGGMG